MALYVPERHNVLDIGPDGKPTGRMSRPWLTLFEQITDILGLIIGPSGVAPSNAQYIVAAANAILTAERVATDSATVTWDFSVAGQAIANAAVSGFHLRGTRAAQPAANTVAVGTLYYVTDTREEVIERSNGLIWQAYSTAIWTGGFTEIRISGDIESYRRFLSDPTAEVAAAGNSRWHYLQRNTSGDPGGTSEPSAFEAWLNVGGAQSLQYTYGALVAVQNEATAGTTTGAFGLDSRVEIANAADINSAVGIQSRLMNSGTGDYLTLVSYFRTSTTVSSTGDFLGGIRGFEAADIGRASAGAVNVFFSAEQTKGSGNLTAFRTLISAGAGRYCLYNDGGAQSYHLGNIGVGSGKTAPSATIDVNGNIVADPTGLVAAAGVTRYHVLQRSTSGDAGGTSDVVSVSTVLDLLGANSIAEAKASSNIATASLTAGVVAALIGQYNIIENSGQGHVTNAANVYAFARLDDTGNITSLWSAFRAAAPVISSSGDITGGIRGFHADNIGRAAAGEVNVFYCADQTPGTFALGFRGLMSAAANKWNCYMGGTAQNYFLGNVGIGAGKSAPASALDVQGNIEGDSYSVGGVAGVSGTGGTVTSVNGIVTAISGAGGGSAEFANTLMLMGG